MEAYKENKVLWLTDVLRAMLGSLETCIRARSMEDGSFTNATMHVRNAISMAQVLLEKPFDAQNQDTGMSAAEKLMNAIHDGTNILEMISRVYGDSDDIGFKGPLPKLLKAIDVSVERLRCVNREMLSFVSEHCLVEKDIFDQIQQQLRQAYDELEMNDKVLQEE